MIVKTGNLIGPALDWAVAKCEGRETIVEMNALKRVGVWLDSGRGTRIPGEFIPSTSWDQGGPIIECERIGLLFDAGSACRKPTWFATPDDQSTSSSYEGEQFDPTFMVAEGYGVYGPTALIAAMRCYVASKLGDRVDIPKELL